MNDDDIANALFDAYHDTFASVPEWEGINGILTAIRAGKVPGVCMADRAEKAEVRLADYDTRLTAVMSPDLKCWHQNSRNEWPEVAAWVITNLQEREYAAWERAEKAEARHAAAVALLREITPDWSPEVAARIDAHLAAIRQGDIPTICNLTTNEMTLAAERDQLRAEVERLTNAARDEGKRADAYMEGFEREKERAEKAEAQVERLRGLDEFAPPGHPLHSCGGPQEACMQPGCTECGMPTMVEALAMRERAEKAESLLRRAVDHVAGCHDCINLNAPALAAEIDAYLAACDGQGVGG